ncbi:MAG: hypothetical protein QM496_12340 [Verrucomicrobiota bacterium]
MSRQPLSIRLILIGLGCSVVGGLGESFRIGRVTTEFKEVLATAGGMEEIKEPLTKAMDGLGGSVSFWQVLMLVGVVLLSSGLLAVLVKLAKTREQVVQSKSGGCGGCH